MIQPATVLCVTYTQLPAPRGGGAGGVGGVPQQL